jgi:DNA-binding NtrC family response regulator
LSQRADDLPALCSYLLADIAGNRQLSLAEDALQAIQAYAWPGNVRELRNVLERATVVCNGAVIRLHHLPEAVQPTEPSPNLPQTVAIDGALSQWVAQRLQQGCDYQQLHDELEGKLLAILLPRYGGKPTVLANALNMNRATLRRKLRDLIDEPASDNSAE